MQAPCRGRGYRGTRFQRPLEQHLPLPLAEALTWKIPLGVGWGRLCAWAFFCSCTRYKAARAHLHNDNFHLCEEEQKQTNYKISLQLVSAIFFFNTFTKNSVPPLPTGWLIQRKLLSSCVPAVSACSSLFLEQSCEVAHMFRELLLPGRLQGKQVVA